MAHAPDLTAIKKAAEAKFPYRIDAPVPSSGLGPMLAVILDWCRENVVSDTWDLHLLKSEHREGERTVDFVRFYFLYEADAEAFRHAMSYPLPPIPVGI
jgi:hypothetical protein